jgi:hypothetical protein
MIRYFDKWGEILEVVEKAQALFAVRNYETG